MYGLPAHPHPPPAVPLVPATGVYPHTHPQHQHAMMMMMMYGGMPVAPALPAEPATVAALEKPAGKPLETWGEPTDMRLNGLLYTNITTSGYYRSLSYVVSLCFIMSKET